MDAATFHTWLLDAVRCAVVLLALAAWVGGSTFAMIAADNASKRDPLDTWTDADDAELLARMEADHAE